MKRDELPADELGIVDKMFQAQCRETAHWFDRYMQSIDDRAAERAVLRRRIAELEDELRQARAVWRKP